MASIRILRGRIKSVKNIAQITKAMEMVAASKMKKAQAQALAGKLYAEKIFDMVMELSGRTDPSSHPLLKKTVGNSGKRLVILISTNKGLCGGLNTNLLRFFLQEYPGKSKLDVVAVGKKGADMAVRLNMSLIADFSQTTPFIQSVPAIVELGTQKFLDGTYDGVDVVFSDFINAIKQSPKKKTLLPLTIDSAVTQHKDLREFIIEPSVDEVFETLLPHYLENQVRDAILEAEASEQSARMIAMRNATDNALSLIGDLTLMYNKARQEKITYEISDMVTARLAVESK